MRTDDPLLFDDLTLSDDRLGWQHKGLPPGCEVRLGELGSLGWNVLAGDTGTPVALLRESALARNLEIMAEFCRRHGVLLAPHAKTPMSPELLARQRTAGAWAFTAAAPHQVAALRAFGVNRIILANELTDPLALRWAGERFPAGGGSELIWYVDSLAGVALAEEVLAARPQGGRPRVLLEVGHRGGRTGVRTLEQALAVAEAVRASSRLDLIGLSGFEGTITSAPAAGGGPPRGPEAMAAVDEFLRLICEVFAAIHRREWFLPDVMPIVSAGGSTYFDRVVAAFGPLRDLGARIVLRSGCYLSHDDGIYASASPAAAPEWELDRFEPAIEVWGRVLSRPEPGLALVNFGRRDVSFDAGLPTPRWFCRRGSAGPEPAAGMAITGLSDQHAFVRVPEDHPIAPGDLLGAGISHPCATFDRWRLLLLIDDGYRVTGGVRTFF